MLRCSARIVIATLIVLMATSTGLAAKKKKHRGGKRIDANGTVARLLELHNRNRAKDGERPLTINAKLSAAAQAYAEHLAKIGKLSHTAGSTVSGRIKEAGYKYHAVGENIAVGQTSADAVVKGWMHSSGHRKNILSKHFKEVGFGFAKGKNGRIYWVTDFGHS